MASRVCPTGTRQRQVDQVWPQAAGSSQKAALQGPVCRPERSYKHQAGHWDPVRGQGLRVDPGRQKGSLRKGLSQMDKVSRV